MLESYIKTDILFIEQPDHLTSILVFLCVCARCSRHACFRTLVPAVENPFRCQFLCVCACTWRPCSHNPRACHRKLTLPK